ncbi:MAG: MFS transporter [Verrucomicrobiota bacterium JB022]|nr:MFS transporter [Verrucomicrobiota bacterium JB022]
MLLAAKPIRSTAALQPRWPVAVLFAVNGLGFGVWAGFIPHFQEQLGLSHPELGVPLLALVLGAIISMPLAGSYVAHRGSATLGAPASVLFALALGAITWSSWAQVSLLFTLAAFSFGASKGLLDVAVNTQAVLLEQARQRPVNAFCQACWSLGGLTGGGLVVLISRQEALIIPFLIFTSFLLVGMGFAAHTGLVDDRHNHASDAPKSNVLKALRDSPHLRTLGLLAMLALFSEGVMADWASVYLREAGEVSTAASALGFTSFALAMTIGRFTGDWAIDRLGPVNVLRLGGSLIALGITAAVVAGVAFGSPVGIVLGIISAGLGVSNLVPVLFSAAGKDPIAGAGPGIATVTTMGFGGFLIGPPIIASLSGLIGLPFALLLLIVSGGIIFWSAQRAVAPVRV